MLSSVKSMFWLNVLMFVVGLLLSDTSLIVVGLVGMNIWHGAELILKSHRTMWEDLTRRMRSQ